MTAPTTANNKTKKKDKSTDQKSDHIQMQRKTGDQTVIAMAGQIIMMEGGEGIMFGWWWWPPKPDHCSWVSIARIIVLLWTIESFYPGGY